MQKDKKTKRHKIQRPTESLLLWCQDSFTLSFALLRYFHRQSVNPRQSMLIQDNSYCGGIAGFVQDWLGLDCPISSCQCQSQCSTWAANGLPPSVAWELMRWKYKYNPVTVQSQLSVNPMPIQRNPLSIHCQSDINLAPIPCQLSDLCKSKAKGLQILITWVSIHCISNAKSSPIDANPANLVPFQWQSKANLMSILCQSDVNLISWGCQAVSLGRQSSANPVSIPIMHHFGANPLTNFVPIPYKSSANPLPILPILCQSSAIPVQIHCQSIANA